MLTQEYVKECFEYDELRGLLIWKKRPCHHFKSQKAADIWNSRFPGSVAGTLDSSGHRQIGIGRLYMAHRIIWLLAYGELPKNQIDHINGIPDDNRLDNLRSVSHRQNALNQKIPKSNTSGVMGVSWAKDCSRWIAGIRIKGKRKHLGSFDNLFDAVCARRSAEIKEGFHINHGKR